MIGEIKLLFASISKIFYFLHLISKIFSFSAWRASKHLRFLILTNPDVVFVASTADFQRDYYDNYVPDKLELWRQKVAALKINSMLVLMPFSKTSGKVIPKDALFIERLIIKPLSDKNKSFGLLSVVKEWRFNASAKRLPLSSYIHSQVWYNFLNGVKPKVLIGIGLTDVILKICGELGIKTIEVQHGIFSEGDPAKWWEYSNRGGRYGPDLFFTWDDHYSNIAATLRINSHTIGYPFEFQHLHLTRPTLQNVGSDYRPVVVVTLSCRLPQGIDPWGMIDKNMDISILKLLNHGILVRLRLHPALRDGVIRRARISNWLTKRYQNSEIIFPKDESILRSLYSGDVHLTVASSTVLEASYLGVPTLILQAAYLAPPAMYFSLESHEPLPHDLLSLGIIKTTNFESILQDVDNFLELPRKPFTNPLNISEFLMQITKWTS